MELSHGVPSLMCAETCVSASAPLLCPAQALAEVVKELRREAAALRAAEAAEAAGTA